MKPCNGRVRKRALALLLLVSALPAALPGSAAGAEPFELPPAGSDGWRPLAFPRIARQTTYTPTAGPGGGAVVSDSRCSASALLAALDGLDLARTPRLVWSWKIARVISATPSEREKAGDDFAARVYISFRFDPAHASRWELLKRRAAALVYGAELPGNTLNYVWSRAEPAGSSWESPYTRSARLWSLGSGALGEWRREAVDVLADYRKSFATEPTEPLLVGIMTDSDDTCRAASAYFADFSFQAR